MKICTVCKHENGDTFKFCEKCGNPLGELVAPKKPEVPKREKRSGKVLLLGLIVFVLAVSIGGLYLFYLSSQKHDEEVNNYQEEISSIESQKRTYDAAKDRATEEVKEQKRAEESTGLTHDGKYVYMASFSVNPSSIFTEPGYDYDPRKLMDLDAKTCWVEGEAGNGIGAYVDYTSDSKQKVSGLAILPGYVGIRRAYYANSYPIAVRVECGGKVYDFDIPKKSVNFSDSSQSILNDSLVYLDFGETLEVSSCKVTITNVQEGSEHDDCCISEMFLYTLE